MSLYKKRKLAACLQSRYKIWPVPSNTYFLVDNLACCACFLRLLTCFFKKKQQNTKGSFTSFGLTTQLKKKIAAFATDATLTCWIAYFESQYFF